MKKKIKPVNCVFLILLFSSNAVFAQVSGLLSIDSCYSMAKANYPLIKQYDLIGRSAEYNLSNASKAWLPQFSATAIGGYLFGSMPSFAPPGSDPKEESRVKFIGIAQVNQTIWDGGISKVQKEMITANEKVERDAVEVSLYAIKERVNQLFFGILLIDEQIKQLDIAAERFDINLKKAIQSKDNGYALQSDVDEIKAEILGIEQRKIEFLYARKGYVEMLSYWIGKPLQEDTQLLKPAPETTQLTIKRPELNLFSSQRSFAELQLKQIKANNMPKLGALGAGLLIAPGINLGSSSLSSLAIVGISATWNTGHLYRTSNNKQLQKIQIEKINTEEETFRYNNGLQMKSASADIEKQRAVLRKDEEIIALKAIIKQSYQLKYDNGLCPMSDLITAMNKESEARSNKSLHELQLLMSLNSSRTISGN